MTKEQAIYRLKNTTWLGTDKDREETEQAVDTAIEALKEEPKHGEWQEHFDSIHATFEMRCSLCDYRLYIPQTDQFLQTSFCPNCGAKMDKE